MQLGHSARNSSLIIYYVRIINFPNFQIEKKCEAPDAMMRSFVNDNYLICIIQSNTICNKM